MDHCLMQTIPRQSRIANLLSGEGSFKLSPLAVANNGGGKISGCFFGDILKFCSPLAYISIHYRSIGRQVTKGHTKICFGATFRLDDEATQTNGLSVDATSLNWGTASYVSLKSTLTSKVPCNWSLENLRVVWSSQVILVSSFVPFAKHYGRLMYCSQIALLAFRTYA